MGHRKPTRLSQTVNDHTARLEVAEREVKLVGDSVGTVGGHCQASASELRSQLATLNSDLGTAM